MQGLLSPEAHQLHLRLKSLHPVEALAVVAATLQDAVEGSDASAGTLLAQVRRKASNCVVWRFGQHTADFGGKGSSGVRG